MTWLQAAQLSAFAVMLAMGQILFKRAADSGPPLRQVGDVLGLIGNIYVWAAMVLYGAATLYWIYLLQQIPLSRAYPFAALSFVLVPAFAWVVFGDAITLRYAGGVVLIMLGMYLSSVAGS
jgi:undecaprenyl phosphate-alpha-L-ara4N flippase subunit ArnE